MDPVVENGMGAFRIILFMNKVKIISEVYQLKSPLRRSDAIFH